jgi:hypothetical protein
MWQDRWPATFVNARHTGTYGQKGGGLVFDASMLSIWCGYAGDGSSMDKECPLLGGDEVCTPGCTKGTAWCAEGSVGSDAHCAWRPSQLQQLLEQQDAHNPYGHNEIVVDGGHFIPHGLAAGSFTSRVTGRAHYSQVDPRSVVRNLPHSVRGVFFIEGSDGGVVKECLRVREQFLEDHPRVAPDSFPLLIFHNAIGQGHFTVAPET